MRPIGTPPLLLYARPVMRTPQSRSRPFRGGRSGREAPAGGRGQPPAQGNAQGNTQGNSQRNPRGDPRDNRRAQAGTVPNPAMARHLLLHGAHAVAAAWLNDGRRCLHLYATEAGLASVSAALTQATALGLKRPQPIMVDRDALDRLLPAGAVHQGIALDAEPLPETGLDDVVIAAGNEPALLLLLDQVTDPHNIGAILRSAAAFGAKGVIVQRRHAPEITGVLAKAASGAVEIVPVLRETNLARSLDTLREAGFLLVGLDERGETAIDQAEIGPRTVVALGSEGAGLRRLVAEGCDRLVRLPTVPPITSLNVSNAAAISLYEASRRRR